MRHPFSELRPEYENLLSILKVTRTAEVEVVARKLLRYMPRYKPVAQATGVPAALLATLHQRESSADFSTYLGNGEPLNRVTRLVPKGRGPFPTWEAGAIDAIQLEGLDKPASPWTMPYACWTGEGYNGFGPRNHGRHTGYLWGGTNIYDGGKYVRDGVWDPDFKDPQIGIIPVILRLGSLDPSLQLSGLVPSVPAPSIIPAVGPVPVGVGGAGADGLWSAKEIQEALIKLGYAEMLDPYGADGSYGRKTRAAVRAFQKARGLTEDGLAGDKTLDALGESLKALA